MLSEARQTRTRLYQGIDSVLFGFALLLAYASRSALPWWDLPELETPEKYFWLLPAVMTMGPLLLANQGFYHNDVAGSHTSGLLRILRSSTYFVFGLILLLFIARVQYARSVVITTGFLGGLLVYGRHVLSAKLSRSQHSQSHRRTLWAGTAEQIASLRTQMNASERDEVNSVGDFDPREHSAAELSALLHIHSPNLVVLCLGGLTEQQVAWVLNTCEREGVELVLRPGLFRGAPYRLVAEVFAGEPVFYLRAQNADPKLLLVKTVMDYFGAGLLLVVLSPLMLLIAVAIRLSSRGPVLFLQPRAGRNGQAFTMYKFRSMGLDAEARKEDLAALNEMRGPVFKLSHDPRVTRLGRLLRRHSLDELPQLINVLRGEMSLVGPRPLPIEEVKRFENDAHRRRLSVRPGLTCLWQISGRNDIADFEEWVRLDLAYIDRWSLWLDIKILLATLPVALLGRGGR
jgi:exopolysaccharide biosynthesis polyprenyl glycosylphosphotransferase